MSPTWTWEDAIESFGESNASDGRLSPTTQRDYMGAIADLRAYLHSEFELAEPSTVTGFHLRCYQEQLGVLPDFRRTRILSAVRSFFSYLSDRGVSKSNPARYTARSHRRLRRSPPLFDASDLGPAGEVPWAVETESPLGVTVSEFQTPHPMTAHEIKSHLDTKVVGQMRAKVQFSVLLSMHMSWFRQQNRMHQAPNAIVTGPTGVGKTHTLRVASELLEIPFISVDTTSLVPSGIAGYQIEDVLADLVREADDMLGRKEVTRRRDDDLELARRGIIFFDEFDKIRVEQDRQGSDLGNISVQRRLLKLTDGAIMGVGVRGHLGHELPRSIDTSGILTVAGGAFVGIDNSSLRSKRPPALQRELAKSNPNLVVSADIVSYGFMPELVARLPVLIEYQPLTDDDLLRILDLSEVSPVRVWAEHFSQLGKKLVVSDEAKRAAVRRAQVLEMGARGLQQVLFQGLASLAFNVEESEAPEYLVTEKMLLRPQIAQEGGSNARGDS